MLAASCGEINFI